MWLVLALAAAVVVLTPLTTSAGEWLYDQQTAARADPGGHAERGEWMIYFAVGLLVVAIVQAVQHRLESRSSEPKKVLTVVVAVLAVVVGVSSTFGSCGSATPVPSRVGNQGIEPDHGPFIFSTVSERPTRNPRRVT